MTGPDQYVHTRFTLAIVLTIIAALASSVSAQTSEIPRLTLGQRVESKIGAGQTHVYHLDLKRGELVNIIVEHRGGNALIAIASGLTDADFKMHRDVDKVKTPDGRESAAFMAHADARYLIGVISTKDASAATAYTLQISAAFTAPGDLEAAGLYLSGAGDKARRAKEVDLATEFYRRTLSLFSEGAANVSTAAAHFGFGSNYYTAGNFKLSSDSYERAAAIYAKVGDRINESIAYGNIGLNYKQQADHKKAEEFYRRSLAVAIEAKYKDSELVAHTGIAEALLEQSRWADAKTHYRQSIALARELKNQTTEAKSLYSLGSIHGYLNEWEPVIENFSKGLPLYVEAKDRVKEAGARMNLAHAYSVTQRQTEALKYANEALVMFRALGDKLNTATVLGMIGNAQLGLDRADLALENHRKSLEIAREIKDRRMEGYALNGVGNSFFMLSRQTEALAAFEQVLKISQETKDLPFEAAIWRDIGVVQSELGLYETALVSFTKSLAIARGEKNRTEEMSSLAGLSTAYAEMGHYDKSFEANRAALLIANELKDEWSKYTLTNNIGVKYMRLGGFEMAEKYFKEAGALARALKNERSVALNDANLGALYTRMKLYDKAIPHFESALPPLRRMDAFRFINHVGYFYGMLRRERGELDKAITLHLEAIEIARKARIPKFEARSLIELGLDYMATGKVELATKSFEHGLRLSREVKARDEEGAALDGLMRAYGSLGRRSIAIFYGKQSINLLQSTSSDIEKLGKEIQAGFIKDNESIYRFLSEILIAEGRLPEAQKVLAMLKQEEFANFVQRSPEEVSGLTKRIELNESERKAYEDYVKLADSLTAKGAEFQALSKKADRTEQETAQLQKLAGELRQTNAAFDAFLRTVADEFKQSASTKIDVSEIRSLQSDLRKAGSDVVLVSTFVLPERYRVIVTTGNTQIDRKYEIKSEELNKKINAFREALSHPCACLDPRPMGKEIYDIIVQPIKSDLDKAGAKTVLWSLDGALRLIPIHALHDGEKYLAETYQNVLVTLGRSSRLFSEVDSNWKALGLGVSEKKGNFSALPAVEKELDSIVREESKTDEGVLAGRQLINPEFTAKNLQNELLKQDFNIIHIATHFALKENSRDSFLLLGDGSELTMAEFSNSPLYPMDDVELMTLSACETGVGSGGSSQGREFESIGMIAEKNGAKAVIATLWKVADCSTGEFMSSFYKTYQQQSGKTSKAAAIQSVQQAMLTGKITEGVGCKVRSDLIDIGTTQGAAPKFVPDKQRPYAHPYYWSPFVLIGNWR